MPTSFNYIHRHRKNAALCFISFCLYFTTLQASANPALLSCSGLDIENTNLGTLKPSESFRVDISKSCSVKEYIPNGLSLVLTQMYNMGKGPKVTLRYLDSNRSIPEQVGPNSAGPCLPQSCKPLSVGTPIEANILLSGTAAQSTGSYILSVKLMAASIGGADPYGKKIIEKFITYRVVNPTCSLASSSNMSLEFGTLNSNDFPRSQVYANIVMNCTESTNATTSLTPVQESVSGLTGVSTTTLDGLYMAASWTDFNAPVIFGYPRHMTLNPGSNRVALGFRPMLKGSKSPTGAFTSQYTLNIVYL